MIIIIVIATILVIVMIVIAIIIVRFSKLGSIWVPETSGCRFKSRLLCRVPQNGPRF